MTDVSIRPFAWRDIPEITAIYRHYVDDTVITFETEAPSEAMMADRFGKIVDLGHPLLVCERDGAVLGYAYASFYRARHAYRFTCEDSIYLHKDALGQGLGGRMLTRLLEDCRSHGFRQMIAVITAERTNSIRLHEKMGFRPVAHHEAVGYKFDRWLDVVHLQKAI